MQQMMIILAAMIPVEDLIDRLEESITEYKECKVLNKSEEEIETAKKGIVFSSMLLMTKERTGDSMDKAMDFSKDLDKLKNINDLLDPGKS